MIVRIYAGCGRRSELDRITVGLGLLDLRIDPVEVCEDALAAISAQHYDTPVLDLVLPDGSSLDVLT